jgi:hypothetical protein
MKEIIPDRVFFYSSATLGEHHRKETLQANVRSWHGEDKLPELKVRCERKAEVVHENELRVATVLMSIERCRQ